MSKVMDAHNRLFRFKGLARNRRAFTSALSGVYQDDDASITYADAVNALCDDIEAVLEVVPEGS